MGVLETLDYLEDKGDLFPLVQAGVLSLNQYTHYKVYKEYKELRPTHQSNISTYWKLVDMFNMDVRSIKRIVLKMRKLEL